MCEIVYSLTAFVCHFRVRSEKDILDLAIKSYFILPTLQIFLSNVGIGSFNELCNLEKK